MLASLEVSLNVIPLPDWNADFRMLTSAMCFLWQAAGGVAVASGAVANFKACNIHDNIATMVCARLPPLLPHVLHCPNEILTPRSFVCRGVE